MNLGVIKRLKTALVARIELAALAARTAPIKRATGSTKGAHQTAKLHSLETLR